MNIEKNGAITVNNRVIGFVNGKEFHKKTNPGNFFRIKNGFSISYDCVEYLINNGFTLIRIFHTNQDGTHTEFNITPVMFKERGEQYHSEGEHRVVCNIKYMIMVDKRQKKLMEC